MMAAPARILHSVISSSSVTVAMTGMSTIDMVVSMVSAGAGALMTTPAAPCISATMASSATRGPVVVPPPTPTNSGICATVSSACVITGSPVKGYTARMAFAFVLRIITASVV